METIENELDYDLSDSLLIFQVIAGYGMDIEIKDRIDDCIHSDTSESGASISSLIKIINEYIDINILNAIMNFYYSYHCKFDKHIAINTTVRKNCLKYGYANDHSAAARVRKIKLDIEKQPTELYFYFHKVFDDMKTTHRGTLTPYDADILIQSTLAFYNSPYYLRDNYTSECLKKFVQKFETVLTGNNETKNHMNSYLFERMYHITLIYTIADFYKTFNTFIDELIYEKSSFEYSGQGNEYFDVNVVQGMLNTYIFERNSTEKQTKDAYKRKCRDFALNLCEFAYISDVYSRLDKLKQFINENIQNMLDESLYIYKLHLTVSRAARETIVYNKIFYYSSIYWSVMRNEQISEQKSGERGIDTTWLNIRSSKYIQEYLSYELYGIEDRLSDSAFDLHITKLAKNFPDCDDIINDLFQKVLFELRIFETNRQLVCYPFNNSSFDKKYIDLVKEALDSPLKVYQERSNQ